MTIPEKAMPAWAGYALVGLLAVTLFCVLGWPLYSWHRWKACAADCSAHTSMSGATCTWMCR